MAHIQEKGWKYLIRIKDIHSSGIAAGLPLPDKNEFDVFFPMHLAKRQNAEAKRRLWDKSGYKLLPASTAFDFLPAQNRKHGPFSAYYLPFRIVRFPISENSLLGCCIFTQKRWSTYARKLLPDSSCTTFPN